MENLKVLHIISGMSNYAGGPSLSLYFLVKKLIQRGLDCKILTFESKGLEDPVSKEDFIITIKREKFFNKLYPIDLIKILKENSNFDIYHGHGLWELPVHYMAKNANKLRKPYIISTRGMLRTWALRNSRIKKKLALWLYQIYDLQHASCLHATSNLEARELKKLGFKSPIAVIPNGIDISLYPFDKKNTKKNKKKLLFLSRIVPNKGIELLIEAWSLIPQIYRKDWEIIVVGNANEYYMRYLNHLIRINSLQNEIKFEGAKFGVEKLNYFYNADLFVLPTFGENFGMAIAEALSCGLPVITTKCAPWEDLVHYNAGWWIDNGLEPLVNTLIEAISLSDDDRIRMGINGRKLVEEKYSIEVVVEKFIELYQWISFLRLKPLFIYE